MMGRWIVVPFQDEGVARIAKEMVESIGRSTSLEYIEGFWVLSYWVEGQHVKGPATNYE
jgi:hypothetical protein